MLRPTRLFDLLDLCKNEYPPNHDMFSVRVNGIWKSYSASQFVENVNRLSLGFLQMGIAAGTKVATVMKNCPEWNVFDMALMQVRAVQVPVYPTISEDNYRYILNDAWVEYLVVSDQSIYDRIKGILPEIPTLKEIISIEKMEGITHWLDILRLGDDHHDPSELERVRREVDPEEMVTIIYTSGTTGRPKGVMLNHRNFISNALAMSTIPLLNHGDRSISFLPLCHVYERTAGYCYQLLGVSVYYVQDLDELSMCIREVKPHVFASVPRILEKVYGAFMTSGRNLSLIPRILFFWSVRQGHKFETGNPKKIFYRLKLAIATLLFLKKWKNALGGHLKVIICGSASLHPRLSRIYWAAGMPVLEAYGLTETSPGISMFSFKKDGVRFGTVGEPLEGVQIKIAADGEILVKSPGVMMGYYNRPDRTAEAIDADGWFHTGDIGEFEDNRYLKITDRKKEMFKTSSGKYIAPQVIEQRLKESPFIENIMVVGENRKCTGALIVPDFRHLKAWCEVKHIPFVSRENAISNPVIIKRFQREVDFYNRDLGQTEKIKKFVLLKEDWTVATGEFSPTLKLRRKVIQEKFHEKIEEIYCDEMYDFQKKKLSAKS